MNAVSQEAVSFFFQYGGLAYDPKTETAEEGRERHARETAAAEQRLKDGPYFIDVTPDDQPWDGDVAYDGPLWVVTLFSVEGVTDNPTIIGSVGSVACERDDTYMRVVAAELAREYL